jgi:protein-L-isoaspartate(D-aspartate) O-methyltransferase
MRTTVVAAILVLAVLSVRNAPVRAGQVERGAPARQQMIDTQLKARGISDPAVLDAMARVPRELFVPPELRHQAYADHPLAIGHGQTISQPYIVAYMTEALATSPDQTVLEIGTGSGYQAAVLAELVKQVYSIEIVPELADRARRTLAETGHDNVEVRTGNGYLGWPEHAPFDRIIVTAAPPEIPQALVDQLSVGGRMVLPVGDAFQQIVIVTKSEDGTTVENAIPVRFVPMVDKPAT